MNICFRCRHESSRLLLALCFMLITFSAAAQRVSGMKSEAWLKMITANAVTRTLGKDGYPPVRRGYALYLSHTGGLDVPYLVYVPAHYDPANATSVVIFLHGAILARDSFHHKDPAIADEPIFSIGDTFNTIVVFPFSKSDFAWPAQTAACENIISIIGQVQMHYNVDPKRIYIGGISMGGIATYWFINRKANLFAGFYTFSAMPPASVDYGHITKARPLYSMNVKDDQVFSYNEVAGTYEQHKKEAPEWHFSSAETGGHRFIYNNGGTQYVKEVLGNLLKK